MKKIIDHVDIRSEKLNVWTEKVIESLFTLDCPNCKGALEGTLLMRFYIYNDGTILPNHYPECSFGKHTCGEGSILRP